MASEYRPAAFGRRAENQQETNRSALGSAGLTPEVEMVRCGACHRMVPAGNMTLHELNACPGPVHTIDRTPSPDSGSGQPDNEDNIEFLGSDGDGMDIDEIEGSKNLGDGSDDESSTGSVNLLSSDMEDHIEFDDGDRIGRDSADSSGQLNDVAQSHRSTLPRNEDSDRNGGGASDPISIPDTPPGRSAVFASVYGRASAPDEVDLTSPSPPSHGLRNRRGRGRPKRDRSAEENVQPLNSQRGRPKRDDDDDALDQDQNRPTRNDDDATSGTAVPSGDVVNLVDDSSSENQGDQSTSANDDSVVEEWACPQCTLLNPVTASNCDACNFRNPNVARAPDPVRTERLIDSAFFDSPNQSPLSMMHLGGGALLGGVLGGAGSYMMGRPVVSGFAEGVLSGAFGGVAVGSAMRSPRPASQRNNGSQFEQGRTSAATGLVSYPSLSRRVVDESVPIGERPRPRGSFRIERTTRRGTGNGAVQTTVIRRSGGSPVVVTRGTMGADPFLGFLMQQGALGDNNEDARRRLLAHQVMTQMAAPAANLDGMSYDQLLQMFGDGTENLGASQSAIHQLPVATVQDPVKELPEGSRECSVCLDAFEAGQERKILPCLHGFHSECIDKWLPTNGCCPICKSRLNE